MTIASKAIQKQQRKNRDPIITKIETIKSTKAEISSLFSKCSSKE